MLRFEAFSGWAGATIATATAAVIALSRGAWPYDIASSDVGPALLLAVIVAIHTLYYARHRANVTQQTIRLTTRAQLLPAVAARTIVGAKVAFDSGDGPMLPVRLGDRRRHGAPSVADRHVVESTCIIDAADCAPNLICNEDLSVPNATRFAAAVKVQGDLVVHGDAVFEAPVIVNGFVRIAGTARFERGLIVKNDVIVAGKVEIGTEQEQGWMVTRRLELLGRVALHGRLVASEGIHRGAS